MITTPRMRGEDRRVQLLEVALELFGRRGFEATSTRDIAQAAGVTDGLIYKYFATKEQLLAEVVDHCAEQARAEPLDLPPQASPREVVSLMILDAAWRLRENSDVVDLLWAEGRRSPEGLEHVQRFRRQAFLRAAPLLGELAACDAVACDLGDFHQILHSAVFTFALCRRWLADDAFATELRDFAWCTAQLLLHGSGAADAD